MADFVLVLIGDVRIDFDSLVSLFEATECTKRCKPSR